MSIDSLETITAQIARLERDRKRMVRLAEAERELADLRLELDDVVDVEAVDDTADDVAAPTLLVRWRGRIAVLVAHLVPRTRRSIVATVVAGVLVIGAATTGTVWLLRSDGLPKGVAFQVAGRNVTAAQLDAEVQTLRALYGIQAPKSAKALNTFRRSAAKAYAVSLILDRAASARHIVIADKQAQDVLTRYLQQQFGNSSDAESKFDNALGQVGTSAKAVLTEIKRQLAVSRLFDQVTASVAVSDAQVAAEFAKDKASLATPERRDVHNIVVASEATATALLTQLRHGASFDRLAKSYSLDSSTKSSGGDLGTVAAADLSSAYATTAFAAAPRTPFGPIKTQYGWNVGEVVSIVPSSPAVYAKVKDGLRQQMVLARQLTIWRGWLSGEIRKAHVHYAAKYLPADPNSAPTGAPAAPAPR
jgi:peptidyl-prolyl cis-trans isomerase C